MSITNSCEYFTVSIWTVSKIVKICSRILYFILVSFSIFIIKSFRINFAWCWFCFLFFVLIFCLLKLCDLLTKVFIINVKSSAIFCLRILFYLFLFCFFLFTFYLPFQQCIIITSTLGWLLVLECSIFCANIVTFYILPTEGIYSGLFCIMAFGNIILVNDLVTPII